MTKLTPEQAIARAKELQGYVLSSVFPAGMTRKDAVAELMRLKRTITMRKRDAEKP